MLSFILLALPLLVHANDQFRLQTRPRPAPPHHALTAVLPISPVSFKDLSASLSALLCTPPSTLPEIYLSCPDSMLHSVRRVLQNSFRAAQCSVDLPDVSLRPWTGRITSDLAALRASLDVTTDWITILDPAAPIIAPLDAHLATRLIPWNLSLPLTPPFVFHRSLLPLDDVPVAFSWADLTMTPEDLSGHLFLLDTNNCVHSSPALDTGPIPIDVIRAAEPKSTSNGSAGSFSVVLPRLSDLELLDNLLCDLQASDYEVRILLYNYRSRSDITTSTGCILQFDTLSHRFASSASAVDLEAILDWLTSFRDFPDVILTLKDSGQVPVFLSSEDIAASIPSATVIQMPREDLSIADWMSSLSLQEWRNWHRPSVELSIITRDRPKSLNRLLTSLSTARYFGDAPTIRLNVESDADDATLRIIQDFDWQHGYVFVHHRVVHGGLLPAVVESWYPQSNDTYGILLEDDIELSPLFYAYAKMAILRYRYGSQENRLSTLFGISFYQLKRQELRMQGKKAFDPGVVFAENGFEDPRTVYLSQVPCSWGAVYFPEHWREFHTYLSIRLQQLKTDRSKIDIVPNVRSNRWSMSWKRYFIELAYLRGYTMLYPNFPNFESLSTNHLELGAHVKDRSPAKQKAFLLPLVGLPSISGQRTQLSRVSALKTHTREWRLLADVERLPVLNLTGSLTTHEEIARVGLARRLEVFGCSGRERLVQFDGRSLLCA